MIFESIYLIITVTLYFLLLKKAPRKQPEDLLSLDRHFCPECRISTDDKIFHCHICKRCISRYDHHCPWINNCVGAHNVGKFLLFLAAIIFGLSEVLFCCICLLLKNQIVDFRKEIKIPENFELPLKIILIVLIIFSSTMLICVLKLFLEQLRNLFTNSTGLERQKKERSMLRNNSLLSSSETTLTDSMLSSGVEEEEIKTGCFHNCMTMLSEDYWFMYTLTFLSPSAQNYISK